MPRVNARLKSVPDPPDDGGSAPSNRQTDVDDMIAEADTDADIHSAVKMKLSTFCDSKRLRVRLNSLVLDMNRLVCEGYELANLHITRLLDKGAHLPIIDHNFYYRALVCAATATVKKETLSDDWLETKALFTSLRPAGGTQPVDIQGAYNQVVAALSRQMATMASNHLWTNLFQRLTGYLRWKYPGVAGRAHIVTALVTRPKASLDDLFGTEAALADAKNVAAELRQVMQLKNGCQFASQCHETLPLYRKVLLETQDEAIRIANGSGDAKRRKRLRARPFTLLPLKQGYQVSHIPVSDMMFLRLVKDLGMEAFPHDGRDLTEAAKRAMWARRCNLNAVETSNRTFGRFIVTDGCAVSVLLTRRCSSLCPKGPVTADKLEALMEQGVLSQMVGVDPGFTDIVTCCFKSGEIAHYSSARYYEKALFNTTARRTKAWNAATAHLLEGMPTAKTARLSELVEHVRRVLGCIQPLLAHRAAAGYRNMRFLRFVRRQHAIEEICEMIAPKTEALTHVGFGNGMNHSGQSVVSRRCAGPIRDIKRRLMQRENVSLGEVDEFRTSITCSGCHGLLTNMRAMTTKKRWRTGEDGVLRATRETRMNRVHKVLHCSTSDEQGNPCCGLTWNRDVNASRNILLLTECMADGLPRPSAMCRQQGCS
jgi:hypothetical protein